MIKFQKHRVVNVDAGTVARVFYSLDNRVDERKCVTLYAKGVLDKLTAVFPKSSVTNDTDTFTDYFESDKVVLFEDHPLYAEARSAAERYATR